MHFDCRGDKHRESPNGSVTFDINFSDRVIVINPHVTSVYRNNMKLKCCEFQGNQPKHSMCNSKMHKFKAPCNQGILLFHIFYVQNQMLKANVLRQIVTCVIISFYQSFWANYKHQSRASAHCITHILRMKLMCM